MGITTSQYDDGEQCTSEAKSPKGQVERDVIDEERTAVKNEAKPTEKSQAKSNKQRTKQHQAKEHLMAYLEIVGENADDLPLTWRDSGGVSKTVSSLTAKQYAAKAHAFTPCDVRVIAGISTRYGSTNKSLSDRENIYLGERAQEPGLSQGGPVANSLLKVIYDFENDAVSPSYDTKQPDYLETDHLFDDDDNTDEEDKSDLNEKETFDSLQFDGMINGNTLSWAELLRRMKDEMEALDYAQVPSLSASRKFDLNEPVYLLPASFDTQKNKKLCLLIGCNYHADDGALKRSHDDVHILKDYIVNVFGFPEDEENMTILLDDGKHEKPTHKNILKAMKLIASRSRPGDAVFIQFSGHGGRVLDITKNTTNCYDEIIVPSDYEKTGFITDTNIFKSLLVPMAEDVTVTFIIDSCDTGTILDLPYSWETKNDDLNMQAKLVLNDRFSFMRFLNVVKSLYDASLTENESYEASVTSVDGNDNRDESWESDVEEVDKEVVKDNFIKMDYIQTRDDREDDCDSYSSCYSSHEKKPYSSDSEDSYAAKLKSNNNRYKKKPSSKKKSGFNRSSWR